MSNYWTIAEPDDLLAKNGLAYRWIPEDGKMVDVYYCLSADAHESIQLFLRELREWQELHYQKGWLVEG